MNIAPDPSNIKSCATVVTESAAPAPTTTSAMKTRVPRIPTRPPQFIYPKTPRVIDVSDDSATDDDHHHRAHDRDHNVQDHGRQAHHVQGYRGHEHVPEPRVHDRGLQDPAAQDHREQDHGSQETRVQGHPQSVKEKVEAALANMALPSIRHPMINDIAMRLQVQDTKAINWFTKLDDLSLALVQQLQIKAVAIITHNPNEEVFEAVKKHVLKAYLYKPGVQLFEKQAAITAPHWALLVDGAVQDGLWEAEVQQTTSQSRRKRRKLKTTELIP
jgi:hypothetical protein